MNAGQTFAWTTAWFTAWITPGMGLAGVFAASFLSATLLPGGSEFVLFGYIRLYPDATWIAVALAAIGNTLGGMTSVGVGRLLPNRIADTRALALVRRHGAWALLLSWVPVIGDALCVAAGWLRLPWIPVTASMFAGKAARYAAIAALAYGLL